MKISIIGAGRLGGLIAFLVADRGLADEIVLVDANRQLAEGQALDLGHAFLSSGKEVKILAGDYPAAEGSKIVIITAGRPRIAQMVSRSELLLENAKIIKEVCVQVKAYCRSAIVITTTNPVDVMNYAVWKGTGFDRRRVIGFGGLLDTARARKIIAEEANASSLPIDCPVLGEHGENMVPLWSRLKIPVSDVQKEKIRSRLLFAAKEVIEKKGATEYGPASHILRIVDAVLSNKRETLLCSCILEGEYGINDVSLGVPAVIGKNGIEKIEIWGLEKEERDALLHAQEKLRAEISAAMHLI